MATVRRRTPDRRSRESSPAVRSIEQHAHSAQHALDRSRPAKRQHREATHPAPRSSEPNDDQQRDRQHADQRAEQPMAMLDEQIPRPEKPGLPGIEEHVVAVVFGQSGTAMPASYVVTSPPTQISGNVAQTSSTARRCGQGLSSWSADSVDESWRTDVCSDSFQRRSTSTVDDQCPGSCLRVRHVRIGCPAAAGFADSSRCRLRASRIRTGRGRRSAGNRSCRGPAGWGPSIPGCWHATDCGRRVGPKNML